MSSALYHYEPATAWLLNAACNPAGFRSRDLQRRVALHWFNPTGMDGGLGGFARRHTLVRRGARL
ncbi:MAG TPA: hypothetical protein VGS41_09720 [Chthonomonadales bacterium]|nr:hypothetical protein [Chthonomonadales bacterium]